MRKFSPPSLALLCLAAVAGLWVLVTATVPGSMPPNVAPPTGTPVKVGQPFNGVASAPGGCTVRASIDGVPLPGSPDTLNEWPGTNRFSFPVPPGSVGKVIWLEAESPDGTVSYHSYPVVE